MSLGMDVGLGVATGGLYNVGKALMGGGGGPNFGGMQDIINQRRNEIQQYEQRLEAARNNVLNQYQNLQSATMARFAPMLEAKLAGRGLSVSGGAFASGVGREAANLQSNYDMLNTNMTENNLNSVEQMKASLFAPQMGIAQSQAMIPYQNRQSMMNSLGGLAGSIFGAAMGGPMGASIGKQVGQSASGIFGGSGSSSGDWGYGMNDLGPSRAAAQYMQNNLSR